MTSHIIYMNKTQNATNHFPHKHPTRTYIPALLQQYKQQKQPNVWREAFRHKMLYNRQRMANVE